MGKIAAEKFEAPTTLDAALGVIEALRTQASEAADDLETAHADIQQRDEEISDLNSEIEQMEHDIDTAEQSIDLLACSVQKIKSGRIDEAVADIQIWLNRNDDGRRAQCAAVAVML